MRNRRFFIFKSFPQKIAEFNVSQKFILSGDNFIQTLNAPSVTKEDFIKAGKNGKVIFVVQELINN